MTEKDLDKVMDMYEYIIFINSSLQTMSGYLKLRKATNNPELIDEKLESYIKNLIDRAELEEKKARETTRILGKIIKEKRWARKRRRKISITI